MNKEFFYVSSLLDEYPLHVMLATPDEAPRGLVQFAHGMAEYKERYLPIIEFLCDHGFACMIHDHRGHGKSIIMEEDLGYFGENGAEAVVEDLHQLTILFKTRFPDVPLTLFGHSMGSLIVRCYLKKYDGELAALLVSGCVSENPAGKAGLGLVKGLQVFRSPRSRLQFIHNIAFGSYNRKFEDAPSPNAWLSTDPSVVEAYDADPLCGFVFTLNGFESLFQLIVDTYDEKDWQVSNPDLPIHFIAGIDDPCIISLEAFVEAMNFLRVRGYRHVGSTLWDGMRHEVLNEVDKEKVFETVLRNVAK